METGLLHDFLEGLAPELPVDYSSRCIQLCDLQAEFRRWAASQLHTPLNSYVASQPQATIGEKRLLAQQINADIRRLGLAFACPNTRNPASIYVNAGGNSRNARFCFRSLQPNGSTRNTCFRTVLPELSLLPDHDLVGRWARYVSRSRPEERER